jgi:hypothetical protein
MQVAKIKTKEKTNSNTYTEKLVIDGKVDETTDVFSGMLIMESRETFDKLISLSHDDLSKLGHIFKYTYEESWCEIPISISFSTIVVKGDDASILIIPLIDSSQWNKRFSIFNLANSYREICKTIEGATFYGDDELIKEDNVFGIEVIIKDLSIPIKKYIDLALDSFQKVHLLSFELLSSQLPTDGLTTFFAFPPEIKSVCNQYLMYFAQFLADLGIEANTTLKEEANRVLFTITPKDKEQALDVIYEALAVYLNSSNEDINNGLSEPNIAIYQWKANIQHLQSQLELAKALMQAKEATIEALKLSNYQLQTIISSKNQLISTATHESKPENVLGGIVSIKKYEGKGFSIDLAEIFRRLKRKFR